MHRRRVSQNAKTRQQRLEPKPRPRVRRRPEGSGTPQRKEARRSRPLPALARASASGAPRKRAATRETCSPSQRTVGLAMKRSGVSGQKTAGVRVRLTNPRPEERSFPKENPPPQAPRKAPPPGQENRPGNQGGGGPGRGGGVASGEGRGEGGSRGGGGGGPPGGLRRPGGLLLPGQHEERHAEGGRIPLFGFQERQHPAEGRELVLREHAAPEDTRVQPPAEDAGAVQEA